MQKFDIFNGLAGMGRIVFCKLIKFFREDKIKLKKVFKLLFHLFKIYCKFFGLCENIYLTKHHCLLLPKIVFAGEMTNVVVINDGKVILFPTIKETDIIFNEPLTDGSYAMEVSYAFSITTSTDISFRFFFLKLHFFLYFMFRDWSGRFPF
jgi:hypothetical protein